MQVDGSKESSPTHAAAAAAGGATADSWEDAADDSVRSGGSAHSGTPATTPEDEDVSMSESGGRGSVPASKPKTKVKPVEAEATTTEKEHVNVVFIGHVGESSSCNRVFSDQSWQMS